MSTTESCNKGEWTKIGMITTANGMFAIVAPYYANSLGEWWDGYLARPFEQRRDDHRQFEEVRLKQITTSVSHPEGYEDSESALLFQADNGGWDVEARFCDYYGGGPDHAPVLCELRIRLHHFDDDEEV